MEKAKAEVLRYLGRRNQEVPPELDVLVEDCMGLMRETAAPRHVRQAFDIQFETDAIALSSTGLLLHGNGIRHHLSGCTQAVLLAATLGTSADNLIRRWERTDLTRSLVLDACATQLIEEYCDEVEFQARQEAGQTGLMATTRFSPGYGDFPLDIQPRLLDILDAGRKIGLTCTESLILLPRKSVTAIIGLGEAICESPQSCETCSLYGICTYGKDRHI